MKRPFKLVSITLFTLSVLFVNAQVKDQKQAIQTMENGMYKEYKPREKYDRLDPITVSYFEFNKSDNPTITRRLASDVVYKPQHKDAPKSFRKGEKHYYMVCIDGKIYEYYQLVNAVKTGDPEIKAIYAFESAKEKKPYEYKMTTKESIQAMKGNAAMGSLKEQTAFLTEYLKSVEGKQDELAKEAAAKLEAERAAHFEKWTIKGKQVAKLEIETTHLPKKLGHESKIDFRLTAILNDGTKISPNDENQGYWEDYEISCKGGKGSWGSIKVHKSDLDHTDVVKLSIKSKYHDIKVSKEYVLNYNTNLSFDYGGWSAQDMQNHSNGGNAKSIIVKAKMTKHEKTGEELVHYEVRNKNSGKFYFDAKLAPGYNISFDCDGGDGGDGEQLNKMSHGMNGGNGGDIEVIIDPSAKGKASISFSNSGGSGGRGVNGGRNGNSGSSGSHTETFEKVTF